MEAPEQLECGICLDKITSRGIINVCEHLFCFDCISKWSKLANTCPMCKRRFTRLTRQELYETTTSTNRKRPRKIETEIVPHRDQTGSARFSPSQEHTLYHSRTFLDYLISFHSVMPPLVARPPVIDLTGDSSSAVYDLTGDDTENARSVRRRLSDTRPATVIEIQSDEEDDEDDNEDDDEDEDDSTIDNYDVDNDGRRNLSEIGYYSSDQHNET